MGVSGGTAGSGSSTIGAGVCSGADSGVAGAEERSGVCTTVWCEGGVGVSSAVGAALTFVVRTGVAFCRGLGRLASLTEITCNVFPFASM
jgi:hypothetical protein